jgi:hypothetical protein
VVENSVTIIFRIEKAVTQQREFLREERGKSKRFLKICFKFNEVLYFLY